MIKSLKRVEILIDELKPVVAEKSQFQKPDISIMMAFFRIFGLWVNNDGIFQNFRTTGIVKRDPKPPIFQSTLLQVKRF